MSDTVIAHGDPFNPFYDLYSVHNSKVEIPPHFLRHEVQPDADPTCKFVISVSPQRGATEWTKNSRWITIGVYSDTGRQPATSQWYPTTFTREGLKLTVATLVSPVFLEIGDTLEISGANVILNRSEVTLISGVNATVNTSDTGPLSGTCEYRVVNFKFSERHSVFRLLPDHRLLSLRELNEIFNKTSKDRPNYWWLLDSV